MLKIYIDPYLKEPVVDGYIKENKKYYIDLGPSISPQQVMDSFQESNLNKFVDWVPGNRIATIKIVNYIGAIKLAGEIYDVRSQKFLSELNGIDQVKRLVKDIEAIASGVSISNMSPSLLERGIDWSKPNTSILHEFNYYYQIVFNSKHESKISTLLEYIKAHPNFKYEESFSNDYIWNIRKTDFAFLKALVTSVQTGVHLDTCRAIPSSHAFRSIAAKSGLKNLPIKIRNPSQRLSFDTSENQLIKYVIKHIELISRYVLRHFSSRYSNIESKAKKLLSTVREYLADPFFFEISDLTSMPSQSTIIIYRHGYKEIYEHYIKAKLRLIPLLEKSIEEITLELHDVATLYEIWCFFSLAKLVLGNDISMQSHKDVMVDGELIYQTVLANAIYEVAYNKSYSKNQENSYSLTFRPDITITDKRTGHVYVFDAKYRVRNRFDEQGNLLFQNHQATDIHKMHAYIDAISNCVSAIAIYVGNTFRFFERGEFQKKISTTSHDFSLSGVGALPLVPGEDNSAAKDFFYKFFSI